MTVTPSTGTAAPAASGAVCAAKPAAETLRLRALHSYGILDTAREPAFDDITRLASLICDAPIAVVNLIDRDRQWFKSERGLGVRETPLDTSICAHAILQQDLFVVPDTREDARFATNPLVTGDPHLRFYAGALLKTSDGLPLGTVCVLDTRPRALHPEQTEALRALARQTMAQLELRRMLALAQQSNRYRSRLMAIAGHDLRTPLRTAGYAIEKVRRRLDDDGARQLQPAQEALAAIGRSFDELASLAATGDELAQPDLVDLSLGDVIEPVLATWRREAQRKGLRLRFVPTRLRVRSNRALLSTLVGNLVGNAIKYTERGSVLLGCRRHGDTVAVEVIDTGVGMDTGQSDLYDAFHQRDPGAEGLGLGLWIVRRTAETLGCTLRLRSRPGHGSRFEIRLPRAGGDA